MTDPVLELTPSAVWLPESDDRRTWTVTAVYGKGKKDGFKKSWLCCSPKEVLACVGILMAERQEKGGE